MHLLCVMNTEVLVPRFYHVSPWLQEKIWEWPGNEATEVVLATMLTAIPVK